MSQAPNPLAEHRVLDLSSAVAGPITVQILAELGAEVIKVEPPWGRSYMGVLAPLVEGAPDRPYNRSAHFNELNRSRRSVVLDLASSQGAALLKELVKVCDILVENYSPRVMPNLGLDYATLARVRPDLVMLSSSAFGSYGPYRNWSAYGPGVTATSGLQSLTGYKDGPPRKPANFYADYTSGMYGALAVLLAVYRRKRTGQGAYIDAAMREEEAMFIGDAVLDFAMNGRVPTPMGNAHRTFAPYGCYRCKGEDSWVTIAVTSETEWRQLCQAINRPDLLLDDRFASPTQRWRRQEELDQEIGHWTRDRDNMEAMNILQSAGVAAAAVLNAREMMNDPHLRARGYYQAVTHPEAGPAPARRQVWLYHGGPLPVKGPAPLYGEASSYVFHEVLGLGPEQIEELLELGVTPAEPRRAGLARSPAGKSSKG